MKKNLSLLFLFSVCLALCGYAQTGACCIYFTGSSGGDGFMCIQKTQAECTALGGSFKGVGTPCTLNNTCPTRVCCRRLGPNMILCDKFLTQQECVASGANNTWFASATCEVCGNGRLVQVPSLNAVYTQSSNNVDLSWQLDAGMTGEFYILRGREANDLKTIGYLDQSAAINGKYIFTDINPYQVGHYQLLFISTGERAYSQVLTVVSTDEGKMLILPNPATSQVRVLLNNMQLYTTEVSLHDLSGRQLGAWNLSKGKNEIDLPAVPQGVYIVRAKQNGQVYSSRLVKN